MHTHPAKSVVSCACTLGEGPVWYDQQFWWVDILGKSIFNWRDGMNEPARHHLPELIGFAVPADKTVWAVGLQSGVYLWHPGSGKLDPLHAPEGSNPGIRFNDGKCDPQGRLWAGTMGLKSEPGIAALYRMESGRDCRKMLSGVTISNGLAWSPEGRVMYYIDTKTKEIAGFDFDPESGDITNRGVVCSIPEDMGAPDGMTIDRKGMLWVALWGGYAVIRINPADGSILSKIDVPAPNVTSCTFGSDSLDTLYITTARIGMSEQQLTEYPEAGNIFVTRQAATGTPVTPFRL